MLALIMSVELVERENDLPRRCWSLPFGGGGGGGGGGEE